MSDNLGGRLVRCTHGARKHRIGRASARHVIRNVQRARTTTIGGADAWLWIGADERGRQLEIIAVDLTPAGGEPYLLVIHTMPTQRRGRAHD
jgi:hypothetical protein